MQVRMNQKKTLIRFFCAKCFIQIYRKRMRRENIDNTPF